MIKTKVLARDKAGERRWGVIVIDLYHQMGGYGWFLQLVLMMTNIGVKMLIMTYLVMRRKIAFNISEIGINAYIHYTLKTTRLIPKKEWAIRRVT